MTQTASGFNNIDSTLKQQQPRAHASTKPLNSVHVQALTRLIKKKKIKKKKKNVTSVGQLTRLITYANHGNDVMCS